MPEGTEKVNNKIEGVDTPYMDLEGSERLSIAVEYWREKLFLMDWHINVSIVNDRELMELPNAIAECSYCCDIRAAKIRILDKNLAGNEPFKYCAEKALVHEMLHLVFPNIPAGDYIKNSDDNYFVNVYYEENHWKLDSIARALIMAKYNLSPAWFYLEV